MSANLSREGEVGAPRSGGPGEGGSASFGKGGASASFGKGGASAAFLHAERCLPHPLFAFSFGVALSLRER